MKKLMCMVLATAALVGCSTQPKYTLSGQVEGVEKMYLMQSIQGEMVVVDSVAVENGAFCFKGEVVSPFIAYVADNSNLRAAEVGTEFYMEAGDMTFAKVEDGCQVTGTPANDANVAYAARVAPLKAEYREATPERREEIFDAYNAAQKEALTGNKDNLFGVRLLMSSAYEMSGQELQEVIASFSPEMQAVEYMQPIAEMAEKKLKTEQLLMTAPISIPQMVLGKFFASLTLFVGTVLISCINFFPLYSLATRERSQAEYAVEHIGPVTAEIVSCALV